MKQLRKEIKYINQDYWFQNGEQECQPHNCDICQVNVFRMVKINGPGHFLHP
jgi:hypothetical protein